MSIFFKIVILNVYLLFYLSIYLFFFFNKLFYIIINNLYTIINKLFTKTTIFVNNFKNIYEIKYKPKHKVFLYKWPSAYRNDLHFSSDNCSSAWNNWPRGCITLVKLVTCCCNLLNFFMSIFIFHLSSSMTKEKGEIFCFDRVDIKWQTHLTLVVQISPILKRDTALIENTF